MCAISKQAVLKGLNDIAVNGEVLRLKWKIRWHKPTKYWSAQVQVITLFKRDRKQMVYVFPITPKAVFNCFTNENELLKTLNDLAESVLEEMHKNQVSLLWNEKLKLFEKGKENAGLQ